MAAGMAAYFLGIIEHRLEIERLYNQKKLMYLGEEGISWSYAVKDYINSYAFVRTSKDPNQPNQFSLIANGEIPLGTDNNPVCERNPSKKRQNGDDTCTPPAEVHLLLPNHDVPQSVRDAFTEKLKKNTDPTTLFMTGPDPSFWMQYLTPDQLEEYRKDPAVRSFRNFR